MNDRVNKLLISAIAALATTPAAMATPDQLCPAGWTCEKDRRGSSYTFTAPGGDENGEAEVNLFPKDSPAEVQKLLEMKFRHIKPYRSELIGTPKNTRKNGALITIGVRRDRDDTSFRYVTAAMAGPHKLGGTMTCAMALPMGRSSSPPKIFSTFMADCAVFIESGAPFNDKQAEKAKKREKVGLLAEMNGTPGKVAEYVFGLRYVGGAGGMVLPEYYPIILFEDGIAVRNLTFSPKSLDITAMRREAPDDVGTWKRSARSYIIDWPDARDPLDVSKSVDQPKAFSKGERLDGTWTSIGGGGNTAFGGSTSVAVADSYRFYPDGSFSAGRSIGATSAGGSGWSKSGSSGTYQINGPELVLIYRNKKTLKTSLFYDAAKDGGKTLWIGGDSFTD